MATLNTSYLTAEDNESWRRSLLDVIACNILNPVFSFISIGICFLYKQWLIPFYIV